MFVYKKLDSAIIIVKFSIQIPIYSEKVIIISYKQSTCLIENNLSSDLENTQKVFLLRYHYSIFAQNPQIRFLALKILKTVSFNRNQFNLKPFDMKLSALRLRFLPSQK